MFNHSRKKSEQKMQYPAPVGGNLPLAPNQPRTRVVVVDQQSNPPVLDENSVSQSLETTSPELLSFRNEDFIELFRKYAEQGAPNFFNRQLIAWAIHIPDQLTIEAEYGSFIPNPQLLTKDKRFKLMNEIASCLNRNFAKYGFGVVSLYRHSQPIFFLTAKIGIKISEEKKGEIFNLLESGMQQRGEPVKHPDQFKYSPFFTTVACMDGFLAICNGTSELKVETIKVGFAVEDKGPVNVMFQKISSVSRDVFSGPCNFQKQGGRSLRFAFPMEFRPLLASLITKNDFTLNFNHVQTTKHHRLDLIICEKLTTINEGLKTYLAGQSKNNGELF